MTGTVDTISGRGFGFVARDDNGQKLFFHSDDLEGVKLEELWVGHRLEFEIGRRDRGSDPRPRAVRVRVID